MESDSPVIYGLEFQARALTAQLGESENIRFLVGTQSLRNENQIHLLDFDEEKNNLIKQVHSHKLGEIWNISSCPFDNQLLTTCYNKVNETGCEMGCAVLKIPDAQESMTANDYVNMQGLPLEVQCQVESQLIDKEIKCCLWHPGSMPKLITVLDNQFKMYDLERSGAVAQLENQGSLECKGHPKFTCGKWNPHQGCNQIFTTNDCSVRGWDLRTMQQTSLIESAHSEIVRDLDFNPNKQYYIATCGDDCRVKFWDSRNSKEPLMAKKSHSHWVWSIRYNPYHDQLLLTCSSDSRVALECAESVSSEPFGHLVDDEESSDRSKPQDGLICMYEEHEDSVYAAEWSSVDPWVFASLSYDGRVVVNKVPRSEKYKILL